MTDIYKAAEQALEALEQNIPGANTGSVMEWAEWYSKRKSAIESLRAALEQKQEPVAQWRKQGTGPWWDGHPDHSDGGGPYETRTVYAAPQPAAQEHTCPECGCHFVGSLPFDYTVTKTQPAVQPDADPNAPWMTEAHMLCTDHGIPQGNLTDRIRALRDKLKAPRPVRTLFLVLHPDDPTFKELPDGTHVIVQRKLPPTASEQHHSQRRNRND